MKIELKYDGKNYHDPLFTFMWNNEKNDFGIAIKFNEQKNYDFIINDINNNFEKHEIKGRSFFYYTIDNVYVFDLEDCFNLIPRKKDFSHSIVLINNQGKIIHGKYRKFTSELRE